MNAFLREMAPGALRVVHKKMEIGHLTHSHCLWWKLN